MSDRVRVAVLGAGAVARAVHLPILTRRADLFQIVAICDLAPQALEAAGERFGIRRRFSGLEDMLDEVEAEALAALNSGTHAGAALAALERDMAVFSEKPLAYTRREVEAVAGAVGGRDARLMVGYMKAYDPAVAAARRLLADRPPPRAVEVTVLHPSAGSQLATSELDPMPVEVPEGVRERIAAEADRLRAEALGEAADELGALYTDVLLGSLVHDLAVLRALGLGLVEVDHADRWPAGVSPPSVGVVGRSSAGVRITLGWHYLADYPAYREEVRVHDERGSVGLAFPTPYVLRAPTELRVLEREEGGFSERVRRSHVEAFEEELVAFHGMVTEGLPPRDGVEEARADTLACQRIVAALAAREGIPRGGEAAELRSGAFSTGGGTGEP